MRKKSPYLFGMLAAFAVCTLLWSWVFSQLLGYRTDGDAVNIAAWYDYKDAIARETPSPRIILVGGSNVLYGLSARQISEAFQVNAINYGTHAALTLNYLLYKVRGIAHPGDLVIIALEYEYYERAGELNSNSVAFFIGGDPAYLKELGLSQAIQCFFSPDILSWLKFRTFTPEQQKILLQNFALETRTIMNKWGDRTGQTKASMTDAIKSRIENTQPTKALNEPGLPKANYAWGQLEAFATWCRKNGVTVAATYPNTLDHPGLHQPIQQENLKRIRQGLKKIGIPVFGNANALFLPRSDFYDTAYHLNQEGQEARTAKFVASVRPIVEEWKKSFPKR